jgi:hypothetical protein
LRGLAPLPIFVVGFFVGAWLFVAPWAVGFPPGSHGDWSTSTWSAVWAGAIVVGASGVALVTTVGLALSAALRAGRAAFPPTGPGGPPREGGKGSGEPTRE